MTTDIAAIFATDPLNYTKGANGPHDGPEITAIIERFRSQRSQFTLTGQPQKTSAPKATSAQKEASTLNLGSLKLNLKPKATP